VKKTGVGGGATMEFFGSDESHGLVSGVDATSIYCIEKGNIKKLARDGSDIPTFLTATGNVYFGFLMENDGMLYFLTSLDSHGCGLG
jgi:hypothetical protein